MTSLKKVLTVIVIITVVFNSFSVFANKILSIADNKHFNYSNLVRSNVHKNRHDKGFCNLPRKRCA